MTFGYNAGVESNIAENFVRIKGIASKLLNALANERMSDEVRLKTVGGRFSLKTYRNLVARSSSLVTA